MRGVSKPVNSYIKTYGEEFNGAENTLNCQISFLCQTLKDACRTLNYIQTISGVGIVSTVKPCKLRKQALNPFPNMIESLFLILFL